jgi:hypothetical protein
VLDVSSTTHLTCHSPHFPEGTDTTEVRDDHCCYKRMAENFGYYHEVIQAESVAITSHNRVTGYFVSKRVLIAAEN